MNTAGRCATILILVFFLTSAQWACSGSRPKITQSQASRPTSSEMVTFYALGDWGTGDSKQRAVAVALREEIRQLESTESKRKVRPFALELGDNYYPRGLPHAPWNAPAVHAILNKVFGEIYYDVSYQGQPIDFHVVPGNHDYNNLIFNGLSWGDVIHQETTAESLFVNYKYYPLQHDGIADSNDRVEYAQLKQKAIESITLPQKVDLAQANQHAVAFFALDTQAILDLYRTKKRAAVQKHWDTLETLLQKNGSSWKIILGHHPIVSHGYHGGYRPLENWLWSGTRGIIPPILRPLPYVGGALLGALVHPGFYSLGGLAFTSTVADLYLARNFFPSIQDMGSSAFKQFKKKILEIMRLHGVALYFAGHDHNLQLIDLSHEFKSAVQAYQIVSGSAGKLSPVPTTRGNLIRGSGELGFIRFDATNGEIWLEFFSVNQKTSRAQSLDKFRLTKAGLERVY